MDDAAPPLNPAPRPRRAHLLMLLAIGAASGAGAAAMFAPPALPRYEVRAAWTGLELSDADWPRAPKPGEWAEVQAERGGAVLVVRAHTARAARELAGELLVRDQAAVPELDETGRQVFDSWRSAVPSGPTLPMTPAAEAAALLMAEARLRRDLATHLPEPYASQPAERLPAPPVELLQGHQEIARLAADPMVDVGAIERSLLDAARLEQSWFTDALAAHAQDPGQRGAIWRRWQYARAESLEALSNALLVGQTELQREQSTAAMPALRLRLAEGRPQPYIPLAQVATVGPVPQARPVPGAWSVLLGGGALVGVMATLTGALLARIGRTRRPRRVAMLATERDPAQADAWLHVVAGPNAQHIARATLELAAHALARGQRVLVVDAGPRLALHERFGREARWGLMECLHCDMPVLGLVQYGGWPGFYLLAHGDGKRRGSGWSGLGQRLEDVRPHFGRVIVCVDRDAPREMGDALAGRPLEGWWAEYVGHLPSTAVELSGRLGIAFSGIDLAAFPDVVLELLGQRALRLAPQSEGPAVTEVLVQAGVPEPVAPAPAPEPAVLDCDLQVRQRLRFLAWMRRVQTETRREELEPVA